MIYLIQWGDNMAEKSGFEKGLALGLAMKGLSISGMQIIEKETEKIIYEDRIINYPFSYTINLAYVDTTPSINIKIGE